MKPEELEELRKLLDIERAFGIDFVLCRGHKKVPASEPKKEAPRAPKAGAPVVSVTSGGDASLFGSGETDELIPESGTKKEKLEAVEAVAKQCAKCSLSSSRTQVVFGVGSAESELMFIGEAPGRDEDIQGEPFVGRAGQLLTKIIQAMGMSREEVYITNVVKCRPPGNRTPTPDEMIICKPYLMAQIEIVQPKVICALGAVAVKGLIGSKAPMKSIRGTFQQWRGLLVMPTFHPAYLLRNPRKNEKQKVWEDMKKILSALGREIEE